MIKAPEIFKGTENFWKLNSYYISLFEDFYTKDKSKDKTKSSKIMWALYFKVHPNSIYYNLPNKDKAIKDKFLKEPKFNWDKYIKIEEVFHDTILTEAERALVDWDDTMKKRRVFLNAQDFTLDEYTTEGKLIKGSADQLDRMLGNTAKLYNDYNKIIKELREEKLKKGKGNKPLSSSDANRI